MVKRNKIKEYRIVHFNNTLKYAYTNMNIHTTELIFHTFSLAVNKTKGVREHHYINLKLYIIVFIINDYRILCIFVAENICKYILCLLS